MPKPGSTKLPTMTYVGIDPGQSGGLVSITGDRVCCDPMPETRMDIRDWFDSLLTYHELEGGTRNNIYAVIERVHSMPKQGVASSFKFGMNFERPFMAATVLGISIDDVLPQTWMKALGISLGKKSVESNKKERLRAKAQQLYPALPIWKEPKSKGRQLAIADALLIATFCKRLHEGLLK